MEPHQVSSQSVGPLEMLVMASRTRRRHWGCACKLYRSRRSEYVHPATGKGSGSIRTGGRAGAPFRACSLHSTRSEPAYWGATFLQAAPVHMRSGGKHLSRVVKLQCCSSTDAPQLITALKCSVQACAETFRSSCLSTALDGYCIWCLLQIPVFVQAGWTEHGLSLIHI